MGWLIGALVLAAGVVTATLVATAGGGPGEAGSDGATTDAQAVLAQVFADEVAEDEVIGVVGEEAQAVVATLRPVVEVLGPEPRVASTRRYCASSPKFSQ